MSDSTFGSTNYNDMEVKYNAYLIQAWIIENISPFGWSMLVSRALPELLEVNSRFSASYIGRNTRWGSDEIFILRWYLLKMHKIDFPERILDEASTVETNFWDFNSINFFEKKSVGFPGLRKLFKNLFQN